MNRRIFLAGTGGDGPGRAAWCRGAGGGAGLQDRDPGECPVAFNKSNFDLRERMVGTNMAQTILATCPAGRVGAVGRTVRVSLLKPQRSPEETYR